MPTQNRDAIEQVVGRQVELAALSAFVTADGPSRALVLAGGPGIGKTTLWEAGIEIAREHGSRVLVARPSGAEARLAFAGLIDLFDGVDDATLAALPAPQRTALATALLRAEPVVSPEPRAIALGLLNALRALAAERPLVIAVDDIQWLDAPSADAFVFAARRLDDEPVGLLLARRPGRPAPLERALRPSMSQRIDVGPLSLGATRRLLSERLGLTLPRPLLRGIVESTLGNPLFTLEVGRALVERGGPGSDGDVPLPHAVEDLLGPRVAALPGGVRRALLAVALSACLHVDELSAIEGPATLDEAVDRGLLRVDDGTVRVSHPLLAAAARKRSRPRERRELHRMLAAVVGDEESRALHLALATDRPDDELAEMVAAAAGQASARGARQAAVRLAEHALRLTAPESGARDERLLGLARYLETAGERRRLTALLQPEVESLPAGALRARGWLLLAEGAGPRTVPEVERHLDRALAECGHEPGLRAYVLAKKAANASASAVGRFAEAEGWALDALAAAPAAGRDVERLALYGLAWARAMRGLPIDDLCARSDAVADASSYLASTPERIAGQRLVWRGEIDAARATLAQQLALADERGEPVSYALQRLHLCELELRVGEWAAAAQRLDEWAQSGEGEALIRPMYQRCRALLAAGLGRPGEASRWAKDAIARAEAAGSRWDHLEALRALGIAALLAREPREAAEHLGAVWSYTEREGVTEPGVFPVGPELAEALADVGELDAAHAVGDRLAVLAAQYRHPWARVSAARCRAVAALAATTYDAEAATALSEAVAEYRRLGLRFDAARSLLSLGLAQRRHKQWGAARESLEAAAAAFDELGSDGWAKRARAELARVGGRRPRDDGELTPTEREIVALAADGLANKEIALALHLAVHTVEVHLSRAYAKLGVRSRSQLAGRLAVNP